MLPTQFHKIHVGDEIPEASIATTYDWLKEFDNTYPRVIQIFLSKEQYQPKIWRTKDGLWTTRFNKFRYKEGYHMNPQIVSALGAKIQRMKPEGCYAFLEIVSVIDWKDGGFSDAGSCWWDKGYEMYNVRRWFDKSPHCYGVKFFDSEESYKKTSLRGIGRCFMYHTDHRTYVFNAKGVSLYSAGAALQKLFNFKEMSEVTLRLTKGYTDGLSLLLHQGENRITKTQTLRFVRTGGKL